MIPENRLSTTPAPSNYLYWNALAWRPGQDIEQGGVAIQDTSEGLEYQTWRAYVEGTEVYIQALTTGEVVYLGDVSQWGMGTPRHVALAFDQSMNWCFAWSVADRVYMRWFNTLTQQYELWEEVGAQAPGLTLDDHRTLNSSESDILFFYEKAGKIYYRQQRDRFETERELADAPVDFLALGRVGMADNLRVQVEILLAGDSRFGIYHGEIAVPRVYFGATEISKVYHGETQIHPAV